MEQDLSREFLKVVEEGAIAAAKTMGIGDRKFSDQAAVDMRASMETIPMNGTIVRRRRARRGTDAVYR